MDLTLNEIDQEIEEKAKDLEVFSQARELIRQRVLAVEDSQCRLTPLPIWSGTDAVLGSLDLSINAIERTLDELKYIRARVAAEPVVPKLRLVTNGQEE